MIGIKKILEFLTDLSQNNNREWFAENKSAYLYVKNEMELLVENMISKISVFDVSISDQLSKKCLFRIYRDVRFSKNKIPYKINMGAVIVSGGRKTGKAGYYIHIEPDKSFLAGGVYLPEAKILKAIRQEIQYNTEEYKSIIGKKDFKQLFGEVYGEKLKRPPKGFPAEFGDMELLKYKSYAIIHPFSDLELLQNSFLEDAVQVFKKMKAYNDFINRSFADHS